jgi:uncharacterized protein (TIGR02996 family)
VIRTVGDELLQAIREEPGVDAPRMIYADWLEENGGDADRAAFIRLCCIKGRSMLPVAAGKMLDAHADKWLLEPLEKLTGLPMMVGWRKGRRLALRVTGGGSVNAWAILNYRRGFVADATFYTIKQAYYLAGAVMAIEPTAVCRFAHSQALPCGSWHIDCRTFMEPPPLVPRPWERFYAEWFDLLAGFEGTSDGHKHYIRQSRESPQQWRDRAHGAADAALTALARQKAAMLSAD